jgi:hypothetical protein
MNDISTILDYYRTNMIPDLRVLPTLGAPGHA